MDISQLNGCDGAAALMHDAPFIPSLSATSFSRNLPLVFYSFSLLTLINLIFNSVLGERVFSWELLNHNIIRLKEISSPASYSLWGQLTITIQNDLGVAVLVVVFCCLINWILWNTKHWLNPLNFCYLFARCFMRCSCSTVFTPCEHFLKVDS